MSEMKDADPASIEEETDWAAAKAFFDNLKTHKPRPVRRLAPTCFYKLDSNVSQKLIIRPLELRVWLAKQAPLAILV